MIAGSIAATLTLAVPVGAAEPTRQKPKPAARPSGKVDTPPPFVPKPIEPLLTRDQLRACMTLQTGNTALRAEITGLQTEVMAVTDAIKRDGEALRSELAGLDRSNADAVNAYNQHALVRNQQVAEYEAKVAAFNVKVQSLDERRAAYTRDCENRKFDEKDEQALQKGS